MSSPEFVCETCGERFTSGLIAVDPDVLLSADNVCVPCPYCGGTGVASGLFRGTEERLAQRLSQAAPTREELQALLLALSSPRAKAGPSEAARAVRDAVPRLEPYLTETFGWSGITWVTFIGLLLSAIASLMKGFEDGKASEFVSAAGSAAGAAGVMMAEDARQLRATRNKRKRERKARRKKG